MDFIFGPLLELLGEIVLQLVVEIIMESLIRALSQLWESTPKTVTSIFGYTCLGAVSGVVSLLIAPRHFVRILPWRLGSLLITPTIVGFCMVLVGNWRIRKGQSVFRIDRFACGYLFALAFALVRLIWTQ
ncbi:MAG: hypothetical protein ABL967_17745 [Bryobacteraceae bacterium]